jgi:hypothetical protein
MTKKKSKTPSAQTQGGKARAKKLTAAQRSEIARAGAFARLAKSGKDVPVLAKYGAPDRPLKIADVEIPCYVLADGRRVLAQRGLQAGLGLSEGGGKGGARRLVELMTSLEKKGCNVRDLIARADSPIRFAPHGGSVADGYEATILPDMCAVIIEADQRGLLHPQQKHLAKQCAILQHGFATVGIIALVDEATGYDKIRPRDALALILEKFVAKELKPWVRTFEPDFYEQIFRLNGWTYSENCGRPGVLGHWTNNIVYARLAPGVLQELKRVAPKSEATGRPKHKLFQWLTYDIGHPKLRAHLEGVTMLMKYSPDWKVFMDRLDREYPQFGKTLFLPFPSDYEPPSV